jgi:hypothetical protein
MAIRNLDLPAESAAAGLKYRWLGTLGMIGAPMLFIEMATRALMNQPEKLDARFIGATGVLYIGGWIAVAVGMRRLRATGEGWAGSIVFAVQMTGLVLAFLYSIQELFMLDFARGSLFFTFTDAAYPFSHMFMFVVGWLVWRARVFRGAGRLACFGVALMLPLFFTLDNLLGSSAASILATGLAALSFFVLARALSGFAEGFEVAGT